ncbi:hypothetical protein DMENIID0001_091180 [Sergentomyia squamirostris]
MSAEKIGVRWNSNAGLAFDGDCGTTNTVGLVGPRVGRDSRSPRPPLPDLIPIRRNFINRRNHENGHSAPRTVVPCQMKEEQEERKTFIKQEIKDQLDAEVVVKVCKLENLTLKCESSNVVEEKEEPREKEGTWVIENGVVDEACATVNPVFLWVTQNDTEIVSVRCEDYDRRNRIRLTKTANGTWKATPRTQMLTSNSGRGKKKKKRDKKKKKKKKRRKERDDDEEVQIVVASSSKDEEDSSSSTSSRAHVLPPPPETTTAEMPNGVESKPCEKEEDGDDDDDDIQDVVSLQQSSDEMHQQLQEQDDTYIATIHPNDISHENEQQTHIHNSQTESVYETFEVDTVVNCVQQQQQNPCKDQAPSLFQTTHHLFNSNIPNSPCNNPNQGHRPKQEQHTEVKYTPFNGGCKTNNSDDDAQQNFKQEYNLNETTELIETIREIAVTNSEDLDLTDQNTMTGAELLDSLIEHSCEVNNISGHMDDVKRPIDCNAEDDYNEEDELLLDSEPVANIISRLSDSPKCLSFTESGEIETILESSNIFKTGTEQSLDDLQLTIKELTEPKFLETASSGSRTQKNMSELTSLLSPDSCIDEMPKDLSCKGRTPSPSRPGSHDSDTIQSPQPSGLPPIPPSPDIYIHQRLMSTLTSPKIPGKNPANNEQQQPEPLNLGIGRKSASPTVSCSEEAKNLMSDLASAEESLLNEPAKKRLKLDTFVKEKLTSGKDPDPLTQLRLLMSNTEWKVPSTLLVPKDRLNAVLVSPAREIPLLLTTRPELRLPEAFAFPNILQDPNILVVSLSQLEAILERQDNLFKTNDTSEVFTEDVKQPKKPPREVIVPEKVRNKTPTPTQMPQSNNKFDLDPGALNIFNQMLWLPYFNHLRNQQSEFMKNPNLGNLPATFPDMLMLLAAQNNLNNSLSNLSSGLPPLMGCNNPLELALWQEAMMQERHASAPPPPPARTERQQTKKYSTTKQNLQKMTQSQQKFSQMQNLGNFKQHLTSQKSPTAGNYPNFNNQRNNFANLSPHLKNAIPFTYPNLQSAVGKKNNTSQVNSPLSPHFPHTAGFDQMTHHHAHQRQSKDKPKYHQDTTALLNLLNPTLGGFNHDEKTHQMLQHHHQQQQQAMNNSQQATNQHQQQQMSHQPKLKVKSGQHLLDPAAFQRRLLASAVDEMPEVGSTTSGMVDDGTDANSALWHPLFGRDLNNFSPQRGAGGSGSSGSSGGGSAGGGGYSSPWQWTTVTITGE